MTRFAQTKILSGLGLLLVAQSGFAKEVRYKDYPVEVKDGERLSIQGLRGSVKITQAAPSSKMLVIRVRKNISDRADAADTLLFDAANYTVRREGAQILVEVGGPAAKADYAKWLRATSPEVNFEIEAPLMPAEILMHEGVVTAQSWKQPLTVSLVSGTVRTSGNEGLLRVQLQRGEIKIEKHRGRAEIDSYGAKLAVQEMEGDLDLTNFAGDSTLLAVKGNVDVRANSGAFSLTKSSGAVDFFAGRGSVTLTNFEGPVRGQTDQAWVVAGVDGEAEVHIESNQGPVTVKLPETSGAAIKISSEEGALNVPESVRAPAATRTKSVSGELGGSGPKGSVVVKSKTGNVRVRI